MIIIQLGNASQARVNGVPNEAIYEFGIAVSPLGRNGYCTAVHNSADDSTWNSLPEHRTTFKLELIY